MRRILSLFLVLSALIGQCSGSQCCSCSSDCKRGSGPSYGSVGWHVLPDGIDPPTPYQLLAPAYPNYTVIDVPANFGMARGRGLWNESDGFRIVEDGDYRVDITVEVYMRDNATNSIVFSIFVVVDHDTITPTLVKLVGTTNTSPHGDVHNYVGFNFFYDLKARQKLTPVISNGVGASLAETYIFAWGMLVDKKSVW